MARKPRPVDPAEGPIQAFAYDLRAVRDEAGNPTYRALAALAGFSATTLSAAAGGVRQPSLEVTLAYVGACGGDVEHWEGRWRELDRLLVPERDELVSASEPPPGSEPGVGRRRFLPALPWSQRSTIAAVTVLATGCALLTLQLTANARSAHPTAHPTAAPAPLPHCAGTDPTPAAFHGTAYNPVTKIRAGASLSSSVVRQVSGTCTLEFTGYCLGDVVVDATAGTPDQRWLEVSGGGVVASAVVHGNPPGSMQPSRCAEDVPAPSSISLTIVQQPADPGQVALHAAGQHVAIVGFAAYFAPDSAGASGTSAAPTWQQIGLSAAGADGFPVSWRVGPLRARATGQDAVPVVAVACLAGEAPTGTVDAALLQLAASTPQQPTTQQPTTQPQPQPQPTTLGADDRAAAAKAACRYPAKPG